MKRDKYLPCLLNLFRQHGYDGATLSKISQATGLGRASLYHHFPGGKDEMVTAVLEFLEESLERNILQVLRSQGDVQTRLQKMCNAVNELYQGGQKPCIFAILLMGSARDIFQAPVKRLLQLWIDEVAKVLQETGLNENEARQRGEDGVIAIQGALIVAQGLDDLAPFERVLQRLPQELCQE
jgi:AcrR family transcriptional regulator